MEMKDIGKILDSHKLWLRTGKKGQRACLIEANLQRARLQKVQLQQGFLSMANLQKADLRGADLRWAILPHTTIIAPSYHVVWWRNVMAIEWEQHPIEKWKAFSDREIFDMDERKSMEWWDVWKPIIFQAIKASQGVYD